MPTQPGGRVVGVVDQRQEATVVALADQPARGRPARWRSAPSARRPARRRRAGRRSGARRPAVSAASASAPAPIAVGRDRSACSRRAVAIVTAPGHPGPLGDDRVVARPEVDRVEGQHQGGPRTRRRRRWPARGRAARRRDRGPRRPAGRRTPAIASWSTRTSSAPALTSAHRSRTSSRIRMPGAPMGRL